MRQLLALAVLSSVALGEPYIRWVANTGPRMDPLAEVLEESHTKVKVKLVDGKVLEVSLRPLLELVRENDAIPAQRDLLRARRAVAAGRDLDEARVILDRTVAKPKEKWMREYAVAARAHLAERKGDKDALERVDAFLRAFPSSRFVGRMHRVRTRILGAKAKDAMSVMDPFFKGYARIEQLEAPRLEEFLVLFDAAHRARAIDVASARFDRSLLGTIETKLDTTANDYESAIIGQSVQAWIKLIRQSEIRLQAVAAGEKPYGRLTSARQLKASTTMLLPEVQCDAGRELGLTYASCGEHEKARKELEGALKVLGRTPDPWRRADLRADLARLEK